MKKNEVKEDPEPVHIEQVQDIIGKPPMWLYRWGISLVFTITALCILVSGFIQYPEVVKTKLKIISTDSVKPIVNKDTALLLSLVATNNQLVKKNQVLAIAENAHGKFCFRAPSSGLLTYTGIIHENKPLKPSQIIFYIIPYSSDFYGEMLIPSQSASRVQSGQTVWIRHNYANQDGLLLRGKITYIAINALKENQYIAEVDFSSNQKIHNSENMIHWNGMMTDAEIITVPSTLFKKIVQSLVRVIK